MDCAVAIQVLPVDAPDDQEVCRIVDEVIAMIQSYPGNVFVGPFETTIESDYDTCMEVISRVGLVANQAGSDKIMVYVKIDYRPQGNLLTTDAKVSKYHEAD